MIPAVGASASRRGPKLQPLLLSAEERAVLERWASRTPSVHALRARVVLACAGPEVPSIVSVAADLRMAADTVRKWRRRFIADRLDGLADKPLSPQPAAMDAEGAGAALTTASAGSSDFSDLKKARRRIARLQAELAIHKRVAQLLGDAALSQERTTSSGC